jgi:hypothetical protein
MKKEKERGEKEKKEGERKEKEGFQVKRRKQVKWNIDLIKKDTWAN